MKRFAIAILVGTLCVALAGPTQAKDSKDVIVVNTEPIPVTVQNQVPVIVQNGDIFNYWINLTQNDGRVTSDIA